MNREYKEFAIKYLYGIIQTTGDGLKRLVEKRFPQQFGFSPDNVEVEQIDKVIDGEDGKLVWVGSIELTITIGGEKYSVIRDWLDEYMVDRRHPNYSDDYFYDGDDCYSQKRYKQLMASL